MFLLLWILTSAAVLLFWIKKTELAKKVAVTAGLVFLIVGQGWLPFFLLKSLQTESRNVSPDWKSSNVIIVLGAGVTKWNPDAVWTPPSQSVSRVFEAARLYRLCVQAQKECFVLASGGDSGKKGKTEAEVIKQELVAMGVPDSAILLESQSRNTFENAQFSKLLIQEKKLEHAVLVTSGFHMKRACLYFSHFRIQVVAAPADRWTTSISLMPKAQNFVFSDLAFKEYLGFLRYWVYQILGLNPTVPI